MVVYEVQSDMCIMRFPDGRTGLIDAADIALVQQRNWAMDDTGRIITSASRKHGTQSMNIARYLLGIKDRFVYADHINGNTTDNRRCNIRAATPAENRRNSSGESGRSLPKGVYVNPNGSYSASLRISEHGFATPGEAAEAYDRMAVQYHGAYARRIGQSKAESPLAG